MLRQALIAPSRALRSTTTRSIARRAISRPQISVAPFAARRTQPAAARWYSEASKESQETAQKEGGAETKLAADGQEAGAPAESSELAELKKQLETKDKEATEWKVGGA